MEHLPRVRVRPFGISGLFVLAAEESAGVEVVDRVAAIVGASAVAAVAAGLEPAWLTIAVADAAVQAAAAGPETHEPRRA